jgi:hypothetical protein
MPVFIPRYPWPPDFPDAIVHSDMRARNGHADYAAAKAGDAEAASRLVDDLLSSSATGEIVRLLASRSAIVLPVIAEETTGFNAIPDAMAQAIARRLGLAAPAGTIVQANTVGPTPADGWHRLVTPAAFTGNVTAGAYYLLADDHVGFGGTFANLRGFIERRGGCVPGMTTLTET